LLLCRNAAGPPGRALLLGSVAADPPVPGRSSRATIRS